MSGENREPRDIPEGEWQTCPLEKAPCPFYDKGSHGNWWCDTNTEIRGFERCPIPAKRDERMARIRAEASP